jgi:NADH dehydrogenase
VPRYRYDQLMRLGWKVFLPISLFWVCLVSGYLMWQGHWDPAKIAQRNAENFDCRLNFEYSAKGGLTKYEASEVAAKRFEMRFGFNDGARYSEITAPAAYRTKGVLIASDDRVFSGSDTFRGTSNGHQNIEWTVMQDDVVDGKVLVGFQDKSENVTHTGECQSLNHQKKQLN